MTGVVIDTNVFVGAAFNRRSASARLLDAVREERMALVWNDETRAETRSVLGRIPRISWGEVAELFREAGRHDGPTEPERFRQVSDPEDRKFAALAAAAGCPLVSNDHHLLDHRGSLGIDLFTPRQFVERL